MGRLASDRRSAKLAAALVCALGLAGCVEDTAQAPVPAAPPPDNIARRPDVSPSGATVAVASITGAPGGLNDKYQAMLAAFAKRDSVSVADPGASNYLVRGYLSAEADGDATTVAYVLDVFDADKHRTQRVADEIVVRGQAPDPWSLVSDDVLAALAQKSAGDLAAVMTNTPEAIAASTTPATAATQTATNSAPAAENGQHDSSQQASTQQDSGQTVVAATPSAPPPATTATQSPGNGDGMTAQR